MKALSVRQPYGWSIIHGGKDVENRTWATPYRGPLLIHAGAIPHRQRPPWPLPAEAHLAPRGGYIGVVDLIDCALDGRPDSPWSLPGLYHWVLANPRPIEFVPARGKQKLYDVEIPALKIIG